MLSSKKQPSAKFAEGNGESRQKIAKAPAAAKRCQSGWEKANGGGEMRLLMALLTAAYAVQAAAAQSMGALGGQSKAVRIHLDPLSRGACTCCSGRVT